MSLGEGIGLSGHKTAMPPIKIAVKAQAAYKTLIPPSHPESSKAMINSNSKADPVSNVATGG
ncbi:hypothetical protein [Roseateles sp.]|uniref:hypothetical protein n=1 Tax=Roseateles sp. TaxID=1971397 RepID=UPI002E0AC1AE|nr:hypothetical protein [Roseateles sp.]